MTPMDVRAMLILAEEMPGDPGVLDYGALVAAQARHAATVIGDDVYPSLAGKAAALLHSLLRVEALSERNRPFAWLVALRFLALNGGALPKVDPATAVEVLEGVRRGDVGVAPLASWLAEQVR
ncbi:fic family toxin-antitoxin system, toxin component [Nonomuraea sp. FMUSA5-5]|uniref:Fic family toxin-antitoxin system, toxin component n=1 Tax=Nonomuraea composti TaxID=2720023 RepID=A0ABX1B1Y3_9ACTN|nr:fic family toxin-antitoxin system, toxin component [Nonomuraea sp. FMUSA5-5]NJP90857.1 fic family toxin-antitoxin system, toxin component [Nonomuraea sp. FMUSA5-5]